MYKLEHAYAIMYTKLHEDIESIRWFIKDTNVGPLGSESLLGIKQ